MHIVHLHVRGAGRVIEKTATNRKVAMTMVNNWLASSSVPAYFAQVWWDADSTEEAWERFDPTDRQVYENPRYLGR